MAELTVANQRHAVCADGERPATHVTTRQADLAVAEHPQLVLCGQLLLLWMMRHSAGCAFWLSILAAHCGCAPMRFAREENTERGAR